MAVNCIFDDYVERTRSTFTFNDNQIRDMKNIWEDESEILKGFYHLTQFADKTSWSELDASDIRLLMVSALKSIDKMKERNNAEALLEAEQYFYFLTLVFAVMMEERTSIVVDHINLIRISDIEISIKVNMSMIHGKKEEPSVSPNNPPKLSIIVDNK